MPQKLQGICPKCGSENLDYESMELGAGGDQIYYPVECKDCGFKGREWYRLEFIDFRDEDGKEA